MPGRGLCGTGGIGAGDVRGGGRAGLRCRGGAVRTRNDDGGSTLGDGLGGGGSVSALRNVHTSRVHWVNGTEGIRRLNNKLSKTKGRKRRGPP